MIYLMNYVFQIKRRFESKSGQYDYRYKLIENINKANIMNVNVDLMEKIQFKSMME